MQEHLLTPEWSIRLDTIFKKVKEANGDLLFTSGDKSVRVAIWHTAKSNGKIYQDCLDLVQNRKRGDLDILQEYELSDQYMGPGNLANRQVYVERYSIPKENPIIIPTGIFLLHFQ